MDFSGEGDLSGRTVTTTQRRLVRKKVEFFVRIDETAGMSDTRLTHVESTLAFQEKTIGDLSDVIFRQQEEIDRLKAHVKEITDRMTQDEDDLAGGGLPANEKPPHY